jgi:hypothetical protein
VDVDVDLDLDLVVDADVVAVVCLYGTGVVQAHDYDSVYVYDDVHDHVIHAWGRWGVHAR